MTEKLYANQIMRFFDVGYELVDLVNVARRKRCHGNSIDKNIMRAALNLSEKDCTIENNPSPQG